MNTQNREPNIRFNQFKELWKVVKLDSISKKVKSKNLNNTFENVLTNSAEFGIIPQRDFFDKDIANLKSLNGYYVVQPNDFVYNPRISNKAPVGPIKANFLNTTGVMSPLYYVFRTQNVNVLFLAKYFDSSYWHKFMKLNGDTGARSDRFAIKDSVFKEMPIPFPSHSEQSAIGSLFRTLDDLLASYKDNLANYQSFKATMLSKIFPKAGQTAPEIRLDGFEGEWRIIKLGDVLSELKSGLSRELSNDDIGLPVIRANNISDGNLNLDRDIKYWFKDDPKGANTANYFVRENDILVNFINSEAKMGTAAIVLREPDRETIYTTNILKLTVKEDYYPYFIYLMTFVQSYQNYIKAITKPAVNQASFTTVDFKKYEFLCPAFQEQQAISAYFLNLDNLINSHQEKISQLETLKKKLLQDMFI
jgi:hypothetical protein